MGALPPPHPRGREPQAGVRCHAPVAADDVPPFISLEPTPWPILHPPPPEVAGELLHELPHRVLVVAHSVVVVDVPAKWEVPWPCMRRERGSPLRHRCLTSPHTPPSEVFEFFGFVVNRVSQIQLPSVAGTGGAHVGEASHV